MPKIPLPRNFKAELPTFEKGFNPRYTPLVIHKYIKHEERSFVYFYKLNGCLPRRLIFYPLWQAYYMISQVRDQADFLVMKIQFGLLVPFFFSTHIYLKHRNVEDTEQHVVTQFELTSSLVNGNHRSEIKGISGL